MEEEKNIKQTDQKKTAIGMNKLGAITKQCTLPRAE